MPNIPWAKEGCGLEHALTSAFGAAQAPIIPGSGVSLFHQLQTRARLTPTRVLESSMATHITYRVGN